MRIRRDFKILARFSTPYISFVPGFRFFVLMGEKRIPTDYFAIPRVADTMTAVSPRLRVFSWALYDFADTIFSMNVVSRYFPLFIVADLGAPEWAFPVALSFSMACVAAAAPGLGALSDRAGRRKPFLTVSSLACAGLTAAMMLPAAMGGGTRAILLAAALLVGANFFYQTALVFYYALLDGVSQGVSRARVSALGTALGYVGSIAGIALTWPFVSAAVHGKAPAALQSFADALSVQTFAATGAEILRGNVFLPTAALYVLFALPCLLLVRDAVAPSSAEHVSASALLRSPARLREALRDIMARPAAVRFMLANFFLLDAVHTVIAFMAVYAANAVGMGDDSMNTFFMAATVFAMAGSFAYGRFAEKKGAHAGMHLCFANWAVGIALALAAWNEPVFWVAGVFIGMGLGGVWTVARVRLLELVPPEEAGKFFGIYVLTGKCSAIVGPALWGLTVWLLDGYAWKYRAVVAVLGMLLLAGWGVYRKAK